MFFQLLIFHANKFIFSVSHKLRTIKEMSETIIGRKTKRLLKTISLLPSLLLVILVRILRPIYLIRFGPIRSERIGHFAMEPEIYLSKRAAGIISSSKVLDLFYYDPKNQEHPDSIAISNFQLKKMWERTLKISPLIRYLDKANNLLPGGRSHSVPWIRHHDKDDIFMQCQAHLFFTDKEEAHGQKAMTNMGIPEQSPFVCFLARDSAYLDSVLSRKNNDWRRHDYRDCSINNFLSAVNQLTRRGYYALRLGAVVKDTFTHSNPKIIDYSTKYRSDYMDIYLSAMCNFFIISPCGLVNVALIFRRPILFVNVIPFWHKFPRTNPDNLYIPKKLWLRSENRLLTFKEMIELGVHNFDKSEDYESINVDVIENTPEEIMEAAMEMDDRLKGTIKYSEEEEELQRSFWSIIPVAELPNEKHLRIGTDFLRKNMQLLT